MRCSAGETSVLGCGSGRGFDKVMTTTPPFAPEAVPSQWRGGAESAAEPLPEPGLADAGAATGSPAVAGAARPSRAAAPAPTIMNLRMKRPLSPISPDTITGQNGQVNI